jgi:hypothetical protein
LAAAALFAMIGAAGAQERGRHGGLSSGMLPAEGRAGNGDARQIPQPFDGRAGILDQSERHCFGQDRQGRRVRVPC